jgi:nitrogen fixation-related uncharacterized protein
VIVVAFVVLLVAALLWAIKHAGFTADPVEPIKRSHSWMGDDE